jgi:hypothetical protein
MMTGVAQTSMETKRVSDCSKKRIAPILLDTPLPRQIEKSPEHFAVPLFLLYEQVGDGRELWFIEFFGKRARCRRKVTTIGGFAKLPGL